MKDNTKYLIVAALIALALTMAGDKPAQASAPTPEQRPDDATPAKENAPSAGAPSSQPSKVSPPALPAPEASKEQKPKAKPKGKPKQKELPIEESKLPDNPKSDSELLEEAKRLRAFQAKNIEELDEQIKDVKTTIAEAEDFIKGYEFALSAGELGDFLDDNPNPFTGKRGKVSSFEIEMAQDSLDNLLKEKRASIEDMNRLDRAIERLSK